MSRLAPPAALRERILRDAAAQRPARHSAARPLAFAFGAAWMAGFAALAGRRADWSALGAAFWLPLFVAVVAGCGLTALVVSRGRTMLGTPAASLLLASVLGPALVLVVAIQAVHGRDPVDPALVLASAVACDVGAFLIGLPLVAVLVWLRRGPDVPFPELVGAAAGAAAGTWAQALLAYHCPARDAIHLTLGHALPAVPLACCGAAGAYLLGQSRFGRAP